MKNDQEVSVDDDEHEPPFGCSPFSLTSSNVMRKDHWKPDETVTECEQDSCHIRFSTFDRRHHCRRCGGIFCAVHSSQFLSLNMRAIPDSNGVRVRVCESCFAKANDSVQVPKSPETLRTPIKITHNTESKPKVPPPPPAPLSAIEKLHKLERHLESINILLKEETDARAEIELQSQSDEKQNLLRVKDDRIKQYEAVKEKILQKIAAVHNQQDSSENIPKNTEQSSQAPKQQEVKVIGMWDYEPLTEDELAFQAGDVLTITNHDNSEWWYAIAFNGNHRRSGFIPHTYVEMLSNDDLNNLSPTSKDTKTETINKASEETRT